MRCCSPDSFPLYLRRAERPSETPLGPHLAQRIKHESGVQQKMFVYFGQDRPRFVETPNQPEDGLMPAQRKYPNELRPEPHRLWP